MICTYCEADGFHKDHCRRPGWIKCLSVKQPWAELIARGEKTIELRTRRIHYRGPLVIVSSAKRSKAHPDIDGPRSRAVALVEIIDCRPALPGDTRASCCGEIMNDEYAWELRLVRRLDVVLHIKGQLQIFDPPADLAAALEETKEQPLFDDNYSPEEHRALEAADRDIDAWKDEQP